MERICGKCGNPYLTLKRFGPPRCERCISTRRAQARLSPAPVIAPAGELVCGSCKRVYAPSASTDAQRRRYCSPECGYLGRTDAEWKARIDRLGQTEAERRLTAVSRHHADQDEALMPRWGAN